MGQFRFDKVRSWIKDLMDAQGAVHSLYALLLKEPSLIKLDRRRSRLLQRFDLAGEIDHRGVRYS